VKSSERFLLVAVQALLSFPPLVYIARCCSICYELVPFAGSLRSWLGYPIKPQEPAHLRREQYMFAHFTSSILVSSVHLLYWNIFIAIYVLMHKVQINVP
jgi:hypothetical protein